MNLPNLHFSGSPDSLKYGERLRPMRDWFALMGVLAVLLLIGIAWSAYTYGAVQRGEIIGNTPAGPDMSVNRASLQSVESLFDTRAAEAEKYKSGAYTFVDPAK
jgi:hypothetical protein